jgi:hypothetical protein
VPLTRRPLSTQSGHQPSHVSARELTSSLEQAHGPMWHEPLISLHWRLEKSASQTEGGDWNADATVLNKFSVSTGFTKQANAPSCKQTATAERSNNPVRKITGNPAASARQLVVQFRTRLPQHHHVKKDAACPGGVLKRGRSGVVRGSAERPLNGRMHRSDSVATSEALLWARNAGMGHTGQSPHLADGFGEIMSLVKDHRRAGSSGPRSALPSPLRRS